MMRGGLGRVNQRAGKGLSQDSANRGRLVGRLRAHRCRIGA